MGIGSDLPHHSLEIATWVSIEEQSRGGHYKHTVEVDFCELPPPDLGTWLRHRSLFMTGGGGGRAEANVFLKKFFLDAY